jgi:hypothetical protein
MGDPQVTMVVSTLGHGLVLKALSSRPL